MEVRIVGTQLPGRSWGSYANIQVGVQRGHGVVEKVGGDAREAVWDLTVEVVDRDGAVDLRGPYVHGRPGGRFLYLSWGWVDGDERFEMFRRAKLMFDGVDEATVQEAERSGMHLVGRLGLTGGDGGPLCAAVRPPVIHWTVLPRRA